MCYTIHMKETRICSVCKIEHSNKSGMKKKDGSNYLARKCYQCSKSHPGLRTKEERFWEKVDKKSFGCWEWTAHLDKRGYGRFGVSDGKGIGAHRYSYALHNGAFKKALYVCHKCDNPKCVNPEHLFLGTHQDNMDDMVRKGRQRSLKGEESPSCKISQETAQAVLDSELTYSQTAEKFGMTKSSVAAIKARRMWKHLK